MVSIFDVESLSYDEALTMPTQNRSVQNIKGYQVVFLDLGDPIGYSALVFVNGKHLRFLDICECFFKGNCPGEGRNALKQWYVDILTRRLFTDEELLSPVADYEDYLNKLSFLRRAYIEKFDNRESSDASFPYYSPLSYVYVADQGTVQEQMKFHLHLRTEFERLKLHEESFKEMVAFELKRSDAGTTCSYFEALLSLDLEYEELEYWQKGVVLVELDELIQQCEEDEE